MHQGLRPDELVNFCGGIKLNIVSFGGGTNSAALLVGLHQHGIPVDLITFADTGAEHPHTYRFLETMNQWLREHEMPPITVVEKMDRNGNRLTLETECLRSCTLPSIAYGFKRCSHDDAQAGGREGSFSPSLFISRPPLLWLWKLSPRPAMRGILS